MSSWGVIDDETIGEARALIGTPLRRDRMQWVETATPDSIRQFCEGIADDNPLWLDPAYAAASSHGRLLAPPSFLYALDATIVAPKLPGVQWIYAGTVFRWYDVIPAGQSFESTAMLLDMEEKTGRRFGRWVLQTGEVQYRTTDGELLATAQGKIARTPRVREEPKAEGDDGAKPAEPVSDSEREAAKPDEGGAMYTPAQLAEIRKEVEAYERLGPRQRLWETVSEGDQVGPLIRGPLKLSDIFRWYVGAQGALHYGGAHGDAIRYRRRHDDYEINTKTGAKDSAARGHFTAREGRTAGMGGAYDVGPHRIAWLGTLLCDWGGDDSFVAAMSVDVLRPNLVEDTTWWSGRVRETWQADGNSFVTIDVRAQNQDEVVHARGVAVVALPSESLGAVKLPLTDIGDAWLKRPES